jgi:GTP-binding protein EngB required for normal cell division
MSTPFKRESTEYRGLPTPPEEDPMIYLEPKREDRKPNIIKGNTRATAQNSLPVVRPSREVDNGQSGGHNLAGRGSSHHISELVHPTNTIIVQVSDQQPQHQNGTLHQKGVQPPRTRGVTPIQQPPTPFYPSNNIHGADVSMLDAPQSETGQEQQAQTGLHLVGRESKALVDALDKIRLLVDGSLSDDIPQVILVGDQSSGKSSLLSAIAGVNLPRGGSTCTRCPTNIKTASADKWACTVSLVEAYIYNEGETSDDQIYPCWMPRRSKKEYKFATIDDESDLEVVLKWAQIALLNPSLPPGTFEPGSQSCAQQAQKRSESRNYKEEALYSPNIIDISITAPDLHSLSFYDLPGLIQHADEGVYLPKAFKQMTRQYIRHRKSLIICAMAMHTDPENSTTRGLIYQEKAEDRTIGVLTMPDRVMNTTDSCYTSLFRGDQYKLKHGYFVTKQPGSDSVVRSGPQYHLSARQDECKFFNENRHWVNGGAWFLFRDRCGTKVIQKYLSQNFVELIKSW